MPDKKKTEDPWKCTKPKLIQVFDSCKMPNMFGGEELTELVAPGGEGVFDNTYHRWYPKRVEDKEIGEYEHFATEEKCAAGKILNDWLLAHSMEWDREDKYFHILVKISW